MAALFMSLLGAMRSAFRTRTELALESLALRQRVIRRCSRSTQALLAPVIVPPNLRFHVAILGPARRMTRWRRTALLGPTPGNNARVPRRPIAVKSDRGHHPRKGARRRSHGSGISLASAELYQ